MNPQPMVSLRPFTPEGIDRVLRWVPTERLLLQWAGPEFSSPLTKEQLHARLDKAAENSLRIYGIHHGSSSDLVGYAELAGIDRRHGNAWLCRILIGPEQLRGRRIGRFAVDLLLGVAFKDLQLHRVDLEVYSFNRAAIRCYEGAGFVHEGVRRQAARYGDEYWDSVVMGILEEEWSKNTRQSTP